MIVMSFVEAGFNDILELSFSCMTIIRLQPEVDEIVRGLK